MMKAIKKLDAPKIILGLMSGVSIFIILLIFVFVFSKAFPVLKASGMGLFSNTGFDVQISDAFYSLDDDPMLVFGMLGLITGTFLSSGLALVFASIIGIGASIIISEFASEKIAVLFTGAVRLLASIPSVVFGLIGMIVIVPAVENTFVDVDMQIKYLRFFQMSGRNLLSSILVLTFMIVPTVVSLSVDAINDVPKSLRETGAAFGMNKFAVVWKIVIPASKSGIIASIILAAGRGIGESIAVSMVCGGVGFLPEVSFGFVNLLAPTLPLSAAIINKSEAMGSYAVESALFTCGAILLILGAVLSVTARVFAKKLSAKG